MRLPVAPLLLMLVSSLAVVNGCGGPCCPPSSPSSPAAAEAKAPSEASSPGEKTPSAPATSPQREPQPAQPGTAESKPTVAVEIIGAPAFKRVLKKYEGKVVLVDFWATWCGPCVEMFPKTVDLHRRFSERGLVVIGMSMDEPEDKAQVAEFLARQGATFPNYLSRYGMGAEAVEAFGVGPLPFYKLYNRAGELVKEFSGAGIDAGELEGEIQKLLAEP